MRLHITVTDKVDEKHIIYVDSFSIVNMKAEDAVVWATNCVYQAARFAVGNDDDDDDDDEVVVTDANGNITERAKPLHRDIYLLNIPEDSQATYELLFNACKFTSEQANEGIKICRTTGLRLLIASDVTPDIAIRMLEDFEKAGCKVEMI